MTELSKKRQQDLLAVLDYIQQGGDFNQAKKMFQAKFDQVDVSEITQAERQLISRGLDPRKIQYLCNVHADVFRDNIKPTDENPEFSQPGHPVSTLKQENVVIKSLVSDFLLPNLSKWLKNGDDQAWQNLRQGLADLATIDHHYQRKEVSIFPLMTKYGITAPPKVMWGVDDKIRHLIKQGQDLLSTKEADPAKVKSCLGQISHEVLEMIFKEEEIMLPMVEKVASENDWYHVKQDEPQIGYTLIQKPMNWQPSRKDSEVSGPISLTNLTNFYLNFKAGKLNLTQLNAILDLLPLALIFVDQDDKVRYFGGGAKIFPRSVNSLGNSVYSCHQVESQAKVKQIVQTLKTGKQKEVTITFTRKKDQHRLRFQYLRVTDQAQQYLGILEVAQDITNF